MRADLQCYALPASRLYETLSSVSTRNFLFLNMVLGNEVQTANLFDAFRNFRLTNFHKICIFHSINDHQSSIIRWQDENGETNRIASMCLLVNRYIRAVPKIQGIIPSPWGFTFLILRIPLQQSFLPQRKEV